MTNKNENPSDSTDSRAEAKARMAVTTLEKSGEQFVSGVGAATVVITLMIILRVFALSGWEWEDARDIVTTINIGDVPSIIIDTVYSMPVVSAFIVAVGGPLVAALTLRRWRRKGRVDPVHLVLLVLIVAAAISLLYSFAFWWMLALLILITFALLMVLSSRAPGRVRRAGNAVVTHTIFACVGLELIVAAFAPTPWMQREMITLNSGTTIDCYVLEVESGFVKILDQDRHVQVLISGDIASRTIR